MKATPQPDPSVPFDDAIALAGAGRHADAVLRALEIAGESPHEARAAAAAQALARIARLADSAGDLSAADRALEHAIILRPRYADLHFQYGALLVQRGRRAEARVELKAALEIHPRYLAARVELAMLDARDGRIGDALSELREVERDRGIAEPHSFQQGLQSLERADWDAAEAQFRRAVRGSHPSLDRQLERYRDLMAVGDPERAAEVLHEAVDRYEAYPDLHALLGACELRPQPFRRRAVLVRARARTQSGFPRRARPDGARARCAGRPRRRERATGARPSGRARNTRRLWSSRIAGCRAAVPRANRKLANGLDLGSRRVEPSEVSGRFWSWSFTGRTVHGAWHRQVVQRPTRLRIHLGGRAGSFRPSFLDRRKRVSHASRG